MCFDVKMDLMKISENINVAMLFVRGENGRVQGEVIYNRRRKTRVRRKRRTSWKRRRGKEEEGRS